MCVSMKGKGCRDVVARQASGHATAGRQGSREGGLGVWDWRLAAGEWEIAWAQFPVTLEKSDFSGGRAGWLAAGAEKNSATEAGQQVRQQTECRPPFSL